MAVSSREFALDEQKDLPSSGLANGVTSVASIHRRNNALGTFDSDPVAPRIIKSKKGSSRYYKISSEAGQETSLPLQPRRHVRREAFHAGKRCADIVGSGMLLAGLSPVLACVAIGVRLSSSGPIIFRQTRLTKGGRVFNMYKFRSMVSDAERSSGAVWAQKNDPRVTRFGSFLRKSRLDELPQLFNVLRGDMSLIGPRPERPEFVEQLSAELPSFRKRLQVKAGLTGLAQVASGYAASVDSYREKLVWDLVYVRKQSWVLEAKIALRTIWVVVSGFGAR